MAGTELGSSAPSMPTLQFSLQDRIHECLVLGRQPHDGQLHGEAFRVECNQGVDRLGRRSPPHPPAAHALVMCRGGDLHNPLIKRLYHIARDSLEHRIRRRSTGEAHAHRPLSKGSLLLRKAWSVTVPMSMPMTTLISLSDETSTGCTLNRPSPVSPFRSSYTIDFSPRARPTISFWAIHVRQRYATGSADMFADLPDSGRSQFPLRSLPAPRAPQLPRPNAATI